MYTFDPYPYFRTFLRGPSGDLMGNDLLAFDISIVRVELREVSGVMEAFKNIVAI